MYPVALRAPCGQESAWYCINKCQSCSNAGLILKPGLESQEGNRCPGLYLSIYGSFYSKIFYQSLFIEVAYIVIKEIEWLDGQQCAAIISVLIFPSILPLYLVTVTKWTTKIISGGFLSLSLIPRPHLQGGKGSGELPWACAEEFPVANEIAALAQLHNKLTAGIHRYTLCIAV